MTFPTASPSSLGVDPAGIHAVLDALEAHPAIEPHGLIIQRGGRRVAEGYWAPHAPEHVRLVYSLSKTFTGAALALQVGEGRLGLDDRVVDHLADVLADEPDERVARMLVRHIASMATGHDHDTVLDALVADPEDPVRGFLGLVPEHEPGTWFAYNQPPVLALSTILNRLAGEGLVPYLRPRLLDPLGIGDMRWARAAPLRSGKNGAEGGEVDLGFSGVFTNLDAIARLGQLHLDGGRWGDEQVLPEGWVADAARVHVENPNEPEVDWRQGYGFTMWMSRHGYRGDGAFGQLMVVLPEHDTVVAAFACTEDMQGELDILWEHLLPALASGAQEDPAADAALAERLSALAQPTAAARTGGTDAVPPNGAYVSIDPKGALAHPTVTGVEVVDGALVVHEGDDRLTVPLGAGWTEAADPPVAASSARRPDGTFVVDLSFLAGPHRLEVAIDPAAGTFDASWPSFPLFGAGFGIKVSKMRAVDPD